MSAETQPISAARFALAIQELPAENVYSKADEIQNSISHLQRSNAQLQEYSNSIQNEASLEDQDRSDGDRDCLQAIEENNVVIQRQIERIDLLKKEIERRGGRWHEADTSRVNGDTNGSHEQSAETVPTRPIQTESTTISRPGLTDEELRRRLEEQLSDDAEEGLHL